jgi:DNA processing protein
MSSLSSDLLYQLALARTPNIGCVVAKSLIEIYGSAEAIFKAKVGQLEKIESIGPVRANAIKGFKDYSRCEAEIKFVEQYNITPLFLTDAGYPKRLLQCYDSPTLLFFRGTANLNAEKIIAIVGTRNQSEYGKTFTEKLLKDLENQQILVVSGMAFGIDTIAHKAALKTNLPTLGVLAHGLHTIYPSENTLLAKQMIASGGGLLSEFWSGEKPDRHNFPTRNRVVAGMADATIVVETDLKGGSMITANLANNYNRDVFALPGRITDAKSNGCNQLIRQNKAALLVGANDLLELMNWLPTPAKKAPKQRQLFVELSADEKVIVDILLQKDATGIDELFIRSGLSSGIIAGALLALELQGLVANAPGKMYRLV